MGDGVLGYSAAFALAVGLAVQNFPEGAMESSIEGISNDHTDAAVITPAAKPTKAFSRYNDGR